MDRLIDGFLANLKHAGHKTKTIENMKTDNTETNEDGSLKSEWNYGKPPNEAEVEVELGGEMIVVEAYYGRDGSLPHWRSGGGDKCWPVEKFTKWRHLA